MDVEQAKVFILLAVSIVIVIPVLPLIGYVLADLIVWTFSPLYAAYDTIVTSIKRRKVTRQRKDSGHA